MITNNKNVFIISGPTASGKTFLAIQIAKKYNAIILNADSCQIYKGLPILSAQPDKIELNQVEHRLYNILEPYQSNSVFDWLMLIEKESQKIFNNNKNIVIVGGSGMYISRIINGIKNLPNTDKTTRNELNTLYDNIGWNKFYEKVQEIDSESVLKIKKNDRQRLIRIYEIYKISGKKLSYFEKQENKKIFNDNQIFHINLFPDREILYQRCEKRFELMIENDLVINEVKDFILNNKDMVNSQEYFPIYNTIGFKEIKDYIDKKITREQMFYLSVKDTKNYAKRQITWFRNQFKNIDFLLEKIPKMDNYSDILSNIDIKFLEKNEKF